MTTKLDQTALRSIATTAQSDAKAGKWLPPQTENKLARLLYANAWEYQRKLLGKMV